MTRAAEVHNLPPLDAAQAAHSARVRAGVGAAIAARGGWLPFDEYLQQVLYAPGLGYYSAGAQQIRRRRRFHHRAGALAAVRPLPGPRRRADRQRDRRRPARARRRQRRASRRRCCRALAALGATPRRYLILEVSAELRARQQALLAGLPAALGARVDWLDRLPAAPLSRRVLANEVADALPFSCFAIRAAGRGGAWASRWMLPASSPGPTRRQMRRLRAELARIEADIGGTLPEGYRLGAVPRGRRVDPDALPRRSGRAAALLIDYGVGRRELLPSAAQQRHAALPLPPSRARATRSCIPGCRTSPPGWTSRAWPRPRSTAGLEVAGYCTQAAFLLGAGIEADIAVGADARTRARIGRARRGSCCCPARWARPSRPWR